MKWKLSAVSHLGKVRHQNEDRVWCCPNLDDSKPVGDCKDLMVETSKHGMLLAIADGMGGQNAGEIASGQTIQFLEEYFTKRFPAVGMVPNPQDYLCKAMHEANAYLRDYVAKHPQDAGLGTTLVLVWITSTQVHVAWVGDSRCYEHVPHQGLRLLTQDHTKAWEAYEKGDIRKQEIMDHPESHILTQFIGDRAPDTQAGYITCPIRLGQRILLCSDGLNTMVTDEEIERRLAAAYRTSDCVSALLEDALAAGGIDNISIILAEVIAEKGAKS